MCDVWSAGVITYILLCGYPPFNGVDDKSIINAVKEGKYSLEEEEWDGVSDEAKDFVRKCLTLDVSKRMTAAEARQHSWFKKYTSHEKIEKSVASKALNNLKNFRADEKLK